MNVRLLCALIVSSFGIILADVSVAPRERAARQRRGMARRMGPQREDAPMESKQRPAVTPQVAQATMSELEKLQAENSEVIKQLSELRSKPAFRAQNSEGLQAQAKELENRANELAAQIAQVAARGA